MSEYGKLEKNIASFVARHPDFKNRLKRLYHWINHVFHKKPYDVHLKDGIQLKEVHPDKSHGHFWGYYDSCPVFKGQYLSHRFNSNDIHSKSVFDSKMDIWLNDTKISTTNAWNWQQGSRLFWVDNHTIVHNIFDSGSYKSKLINLKTGKTKVISAAIYAYHRETQSALGLNFKRLAFLDSSYGYFSDGAPLNFDFNDEEDGIFNIDLSNNEKILAISMSALKKLKPNPTMSDAKHGINHIQIAPSGKRFMFLHQWYMKNGRKFGRLITSDMDGSNMYVLSDDGMVSHCNWKNNNEIIGWMFKQNFGNGYFLLKDQSDDFKQIGKGILTQDGHPSYSPCAKFLLTDTYPDRYRMSHLLLFDLVSKKLLTIGSFYTPLEYHGEYRCDLHPRYTDSENITVDTVYQGIRKQVELNISKLL